MINKLYDGHLLLLTAPYDRLSGQGALVGSIFGVACVDVLSGVSAAFEVTGVFDLPKAALPVSEGAKMYWDAAAKNVTPTATANTLIGVSIEAYLAGNPTCRVRLGIVA